jgi:hypothetical protein
MLATAESFSTEVSESLGARQCRNHDALAASWASFLKFYSNLLPDRSTSSRQALYGD